MEVGVGDTEGRQDVEDVAEGAQQDVAGEELALQAGADLVEGAIGGGRGGGAPPLPPIGRAACWGRE